jgi:hypothetical protein
MKIFRLILLLSIALVVINGCATLPMDADPKASLRARAEEYWKLRMQDKYEDTYSMEDRSGLPPFPDYREKAMLMRKLQPKFTIGDIKIDGNNGEVKMTYYIDFPGVPKPLSEVVYDDWVFTRGKWLHRFPAK